MVECALWVVPVMEQIACSTKKSNSPTEQQYYYKCISGAKIKIICNPKHNDMMLVWDSGSFENLYTSKPTGGGGEAPKKLNCL